MRKFIFIFAFFLLGGYSHAETYRFAGGPAGGTFQYYAEALASLALKAELNVKPNSSEGSIVNIRLVNSGKSDFAVAYSGDVFKALNGIFSNDTKKYSNVLAMCYFFSAAAQLIVKSDSDIKSAKELRGKSVGVGNFGSAALASCELFFSEIGLWHSIRKRFDGYNQAEQSFSKGELDAFWIFTGFPNDAAEKAAAHNTIALIDLLKDIQETDMFKKYPYFTKTSIPANTYRGVVTDTPTFQDSALWIVNPRVPAEDVYKFLSIVYSDEGLKFMAQIHPSAKEMSIGNGLKGVVTPLHPGAGKFWKEKGILK
ncbi:MAG: C4-dicarboxylate ABC transporter substrate-binding protein [Desulfobacteraceae bacterium IS3]|nr:MAG: C4-dicarboxylate ABC transporter substrate-binding protein [Desulfobacteraceae bacterium IS3]